MLRCGGASSPPPEHAPRVCVATQTNKPRERYFFQGLRVQEKRKKRKMKNNKRPRDPFLMRSIVRWPDMLVCTYLASCALRIFDSAEEKDIKMRRRERETKRERERKRGENGWLEIGGKDRRGSIQNDESHEARFRSAEKPVGASDLWSW